MPIEFRCSMCRRLLRTSDDTAGKQAKCPECGAIVAVPLGNQPSEAGPAASESPFGAAATPAAESRPAADSGNPFAPVPVQAPGGEVNPYVSPQAMSAAYQSYSPPTTMVPAKIEVEDILRHSWHLYMNNFALCFFAPLVMVVLLVGAYIVFLIGFAGAGAILGAQGAGPEIAVVAVLVAIAFVVLLFFLIHYLQAGLTVLFLKVCRGEDARMGDLFSGGGNFWCYLGTSLLFGLMVAIGMILCIVPGYLAMIVFGPCLYLSIDRRVGVIEALRLSSQLTKGRRMDIFIVLLVMYGIAMLGGMVPCGQLFVMPFITLAMTVMYLRLTGQHVVPAPPKKPRPIPQAATPAAPTTPA